MTSRYTLAGLARRGLDPIRIVAISRYALASPTGSATGSYLMERYRALSIKAAVETVSVVPYTVLAAPAAPIKERHLKSEAPVATVEAFR